MLSAISRLKWPTNRISDLLSANFGLIWPTNPPGRDPQLTGRTLLFRMNSPSCMLVTITVPLGK